MQKSRKILIVEDEALTSMLIRKYLERCGHEVMSSFSTAEDAIQFCQNTKPEIVLMDIQLAGSMDGISAAEIIKKNCARIIFMTGYSDESTRQKALALNPVDYLIKPVNMKTLDSVIQSA